MTSARRPKRHDDRDEDRLEILAHLALSATDADASRPACRAAHTPRRRSPRRTSLVHRGAERVEGIREPWRSRAFRSRMMAASFRSMSEVASSMRAPARSYVWRQRAGMSARRGRGRSERRQHVARSPERHLDSVKMTMPTGICCSARVRLDRPEQRRVVDSALGRERPHQGIRQRKREQDEPGRPVESPEEAILFEPKKVGSQRSS